MLARYSKGAGPRKTASAKTSATTRKATAPARSRGRTRAAKDSSSRPHLAPLGDQVLALATG